MSGKISKAKHDEEETMTTWREIIKTGDVQAVRDHIAAGADADAKDDKGNTVEYFMKRGKESANFFPDLS